MKSKPGLFISFEGGEGSGKSTQIHHLATWFREQGRDVVVTREPGGSPGAEEIRNLILTGDPGRWDAVTEALLMFAKSFFVTGSQTHQLSIKATAMALVQTISAIFGNWRSAISNLI